MGTKAVDIVAIRDVLAGLDAAHVVMNARYKKMFGDWSEPGFTDMVNGCGQQSQDYSQVETWPVFAQLLQK